jgi:hypothetical protein
VNLKKIAWRFSAIAFALVLLGFLAVERHPKEFFGSLHHYFFHEKFAFTTDIKPEISAKISKLSWAGMWYGKDGQKPVRGFQLAYLFDEQEKQYYYLFINVGDENLCIASPIFPKLTGSRFVYLAANETKYLVVSNKYAAPVVSHDLVRMFPVTAGNCGVRARFLSDEAATSMQLMVPGR